MKSPVVFSLFDQDAIRNRLCHVLHYEPGQLDIHSFPDGESKITITTDVRHRTLIFIVSLDRPNEKIMPLILAIETARASGARQVGLIVPYLPYMRQDIAFNPGEGVSSQYFATLLSRYCDWLVTIDPHLHRWHALEEIFTIDARVLHAGDAIASWLGTNVHKPLLIGPDIESTQWVSAIAYKSKAPYCIVEKKRLGDTEVSASLPEIEQYPHHTPVLIDDIISTGRTMIETIQHIKMSGITDIICLAVHAVFADHAYDDLKNTQLTDIVTCNTIPHPSNKIDIADLLIHAFAEKVRESDR